MDELRGDRATWQFDGRSIHIEFHTRRNPDPVLGALGRCEVPVSAISSVDFRPGEKRQDWSLRLRLRERADPYAAAGAALADRSDPFRLAGPARTRLVAEYWAGELAAAAGHAARGLSGPAAAVSPEVALRFVPPLPLHIQTAEGTAAFDGATVRLVWSGSSAGRRKRRQQRREVPLPELAGVDWVPSDGWEWGHLRLVTHHAEGQPAVRPKDDLSCLLCNAGREGAAALLLAATVTAHVWASGSGRPPAGGADPGASTIYDRIRELARLHADGILTDEEFATKKAELLDRL